MLAVIIKWHKLAKTCFCCTSFSQQKQAKPAKITFHDNAQTWASDTDINPKHLGTS